MALTRSAGARKDGVRGTTPIEVRKAAAARWASTGVVADSASPLVIGTAGFAYSVGNARFVTSRGVSDGVHEFTNDGALSIACPVAPGSGLSRIDIVWVSHPAAGENGDLTSQPILGVSSGTAAASNPAVPSIPTGALELGRNTMTSAATTTASAGNTIAQTAVTAYPRDSRPKAKTDNSGWSSVSSDAGGNITIAHGLGVKPVAFFANITATGTTALVQQLGKVIAGGSDATNISFTTIRSDTGAALVGTIGFYWFATL